MIPCTHIALLTDPANHPLVQTPLTHAALPSLCRLCCHRDHHYHHHAGQLRRDIHIHAISLVHLATYHLHQSPYSNLLATQRYYIVSPAISFLGNTDCLVELLHTASQWSISLFASSFALALPNITESLRTLSNHWCSRSIPRHNAYVINHRSLSDPAVATFCFLFNIICKSHCIHVHKVYYLQGYHL